MIIKESKYTIIDCQNVKLCDQILCFLGNQECGLVKKLYSGSPPTQYDNPL